MEDDTAAYGAFDPAPWLDDGLRQVDLAAGAAALATLLATSPEWLPQLSDERQRAMLLRRHAVALRQGTPLYELTAALIAPWLAHRFAGGRGGAPVAATSRANLVALLAHLHRPASTATDPWLGLTEWVWTRVREQAGAHRRGLDPLDHSDPDAVHRQAVELLLAYAQEFARSVVDTLAVEEASGERLDLLRGRRTVGDPAALLPAAAEPIADPATLSPRPVDDHLTIMGLGHYQAVREALYKNTFGEMDGQLWPTAELTRRGEVLGRAQLRPPGADARQLLQPDQIELWSTKMWQQRGELSDLDADVLDALSAIWLHQARSVQDSARAAVDALLAMRGIAPKLRGDGRRSGYHHRQRQEALRALAHIQNLWIDIAEREIEAAPGWDDGDAMARRRSGRLVVQSRAFVITDRVGIAYDSGEFDVNFFYFRPGEVFAAFLLGPGNQTALLSARALRYDPYRQVWEKRLARFLSWQWRATADGSVDGQIYTVGELLNAVGKEVDTRRPTETRDRLDRALDTLAEDGVIASWNYRDWREPANGQRGWVADWLESEVLVAPPDVVAAHYRQLGLPIALLPAGAVEAAPSNPAPPALPPSPEAIGVLIKATRKARGDLTQADVAAALGVTQGFISKLERGHGAGRHLADISFRQRLAAWLAD